jgi:SAM-dependent methyltransferase
MSNDLKAYFEGMKQPMWTLFYRVVGEQLSNITNSKILDFGSGLGITANHLAKNNDVVAIEPNADLAEMRICENSYEQIIGDIEKLRQQQDNSFDVVVCHNVLEYTNEQRDIFMELCRVLKPNGILSIVKQNRAGRIMQLTLENNVDEAISQLDGGTTNVIVFGQVNYYDIKDVKDWIGYMNVNIEKVLGIRTFWSLQQNNGIKNDPTWQEKMLEIEMKVSNINDYINISFFNHVILKKFS